MEGSKCLGIFEEIGKRWLVGWERVGRRALARVGYLAEARNQNTDGGKRGRTEGARAVDLESLQSGKARSMTAEHKRSFLPFQVQTGC